MSMYTGSNNVSVTFNVDDKVYNSTYNIRTAEMFTLWYKVNGKTYKGTRVSNTLVDGIGLIVFSIATVENGNYTFRIELSNGLLEGSSTRTKRVAVGSIIKAPVSGWIHVDKSATASGTIGEVEGMLSLKCFPCDASGTVLASSEPMTIARTIIREVIEYDLPLGRKFKQEVTRIGGTVQESSIWSHYIIKAVSPLYGTVLDNQVAGTVDADVRNESNTYPVPFNVALNTVFTLSGLDHTDWKATTINIRAVGNYVGPTNYNIVSYSPVPVSTSVTYITV